MYLFNETLPAACLESFLVSRVTAEQLVRTESAKNDTCPALVGIRLACSVSHMSSSAGREVQCQSKTLNELCQTLEEHKTGRLTRSIIDWDGNISCSTSGRVACVSLYGTSTSTCAVEISGSS